jgi:hypothetical protein
VKTLGLDRDDARRIPLERLNENAPRVRGRGELTPTKRPSLVHLMRLRDALVAGFRFPDDVQEDKPSIGRRKHGSPTHQRSLTYVAVEYGNQNASRWLSGFHCFSFASERFKWRCRTIER